MPDIKPISIPWYSTLEIYKEMAALAGSKNPMPYPEWISQIEAFEQGFRAAGNMPVRKEIDPAAFKSWCKAIGVPTKRAAIAQYAAETMIRRFKKDN